jgi:hypothetical protein
MKPKNTCFEKQRTFLTTRLLLTVAYPGRKLLTWAITGDILDETGRANSTLLLCRTYHECPVFWMWRTCDLCFV